MISQYLQSTHAPTHSDYTMTLLEVFEVEKEGEREAFREDLHNRWVQLWASEDISFSEITVKELGGVAEAAVGFLYIYYLCL